MKKGVIPVSYTHLSARQTRPILNLTSFFRISPSPRRSSETYAMPFLIASLGDLILTGLPSRRISPPLFSYAPKIVFISSVRPAPTSPAKPTISPYRALKLASLNSLTCDRFFVSSATSPILCLFMV